MICASAISLLLPSKKAPRCLSSPPSCAPRSSKPSSGPRGGATPRHSAMRAPGAAVMMRAQPAAQVREFREQATRRIERTAHRLRRSGAVDAWFRECDAAVREVSAGVNGPLLEQLCSESGHTDQGAPALFREATRRGLARAARPWSARLLRRGPRLWASCRARESAKQWSSRSAYLSNSCWKRRARAIAPSARGREETSMPRSCTRWPWRMRYLGA